MKKPKKTPIIGVIWKVAFNALKSNPIIILPFCISGVLKLLGLVFIFISIFYPLSLVFAPIIKTLWGEAYLHYPFNFNLMPKLFYYAQVSVYVLMDGLLSGIAVWMIFRVNEGKKPVFSEALKKVFPKYIILVGFLLTVFLIVYMISFGENFAIMKLLRFKFMTILLKRGLLDFIKIFLNFFIIVLIETLFAFVIPFVVLKGRGFFKAIGGSLSLAKKLFFTVFILIIIPTTISLPISLLKAGLPALIAKTLPEITFLVLGAGVILTVFIDWIVTTSLALLFLLRKDLGLEKIK